MAQFNFLLFRRCWQILGIWVTAENWEISMSTGGMLWSVSELNIQRWLTLGRYRHVPLSDANYHICDVSDNYVHVFDDNSNHIYSNYSILNIKMFHSFDYLVWMFSNLNLNSFVYHLIYQLHLNNWLCGRLYHFYVNPIHYYALALSIELCRKTRNIN